MQTRTATAGRRKPATYETPRTLHNIDLHHKVPFPVLESTKNSTNRTRMKDSLLERCKDFGKPQRHERWRSLQEYGFKGIPKELYIVTQPDRSELYSSFLELLAESPTSCKHKRAVTTCIDSSAARDLSFRRHEPKRYFTTQQSRRPRHIRTLTAAEAAYRTLQTRKARCSQDMDTQILNMCSEFQINPEIIPENVLLVQDQSIRLRNAFKQF